MDEMAVLNRRRTIRERYSQNFPSGPAYNQYTFYGNEEQEQRLYRTGC